MYHQNGENFHLEEGQKTPPNSSGPEFYDDIGTETVLYPEDWVGFINNGADKMVVCRSRQLFHRYC